jgi:prepilin-type N-terminal cleavage/methylation domain-containing protein
MSRLRGRRALTDRDRGTTLTEMLVVMIVMGIVVAATATLTIGMTRTTAQNTARQDQIDIARTSVERISKTVRTAVKPSQLLTSCSESCLSASAFLNGTTTSMQFYANLDNPGNRVGPSRITYSVAADGADAGVLVERIQRPDTSTPGVNGYTYCNAEAAGATSTCRQNLTVRRHATGVGTARLFSYYRADGQRLVPAGDGRLSVADLKRVTAVEIQLTVSRTGAYAPKPTTYIQRITLPNAQAVVQAGEDTP